MLKRGFGICRTGLHSKTCVVVGAQWGDEGKGKLVDILAENYNIVGRYNGGANAGHTVVANGKKYAFHLLPCGILYKNVMNVIGNGVVLHVPTLFKELSQLDNSGIDYAGRLLISDRAHLVTQAHIEADGSHETALGGKSLGTTKRGIGPTYSTKAMRIGLRVGDLLHWSYFVDRYNGMVDYLEKAFPIKVDRAAELAEFESYKKRMEGMITDTIYYVNKETESGKRLIAEGANALMLDLDYGTYPYVTSSSTGVAGVSSGLGIAPTKLETTVGVVKAYTTRVGLGPFPTEETGEIGEHLVAKGREFGTTTGRKRRCGWLDLNVVKYTHMINNYTSINITKLDVLDELEEIQIGVGYSLNGQKLNSIPASLEDLGKVKVDYLKMPGWRSDTTKVLRWQDLPPQAKAYLSKISELTGVPITWVGTGPNRENMLKNPDYS
jgi:adenylosuccinate synthase